MAYFIIKVLFLAVMVGAVVVGIKLLDNIHDDEDK